MIIYLAEQRGTSQLDGLRSFHTFNFGTYQDPSRKPFGALQVFNDDTLKGGGQLTMHVEENTDILLLPIVGAIAFKNSLDTEESYLSAGEGHIFSAAKGMWFEMGNPYETDLVNVLQIWIKNDTQPFEPKIHAFDFDLLAHKNQLIPLFTSDTEGVYIGQFDGRQDGIYTLKNSKNGVFAFVIEGAFEVQNRLLEPRDGLALSAVESIEFEALSNNALILFLEIKITF